MSVITPEKSWVAPSPAAERRVDLLREPPHLRIRRGLLDRLQREPQVLGHQRTREPRLIVAVGRARRHRPRHGAVRRDRPALAGRLRHDVEQRLVLESEPLPQHERLGDGDLRHRQDHVVADLRGLAEARAAAVHDALPHDLEQRKGRGEVVVGSADHECQRAVLGTDHSARHGGVDVAVTGGERKRVRGPRLVDRDRGRLDEQRPRPRRGEQLGPIGLDHVLPGGEHRDDDVGLGDGIRSARGDRDACRLRRFDRRGGEVEAVHLVTGGDEVLGHRQAHVAEPQEGDDALRLAHDALRWRSPPFRWRDADPAGRSISRPTIRRMISFVPSKI
ncbi:hypothetical protein QFZ21_003180 [Microbacterium sp. W4I20]|nr:hypothetical protein [Microbacterium sp. W4I20]